MNTKLAVFLILNFAFILDCNAGSATWSSNPTSSDWNTAANWIPPTVPNGPADIATFDTSSQTSVDATDVIEVDSIVFNPGGSAFTIFCPPPNSFADFTISGAGIVNQSGILQNIVVGSNGEAHLFFLNSAAVGDFTNFTIQGATNVPLSLIFCEFVDSSSAGNAAFTVQGAGPPSGIDGGVVLFGVNATAGTATITAEPGTIAGGFGGGIAFEGGTADHATIILNGASVANAHGGAIVFRNSATAAQATLIANGGRGDMPTGGRIGFDDHSSGGTARVQLFGNGTLTIAPHENEAVEIGSIEGNGLVLLGTTPLTVGTNNLSTMFSGVIQGSDTFTKTGAGTLILTGSNVYTGNTIILDGFLRVDNRSGSATGTGAVEVHAGTLGGGGFISGNVTVGTGNGTGAFIAPGSGNTTLTIQSAATFNPDGTYTWRVRPRGTADKLVANGVTIESGAQIIGLGRGTLPIGTVLTAISNTSANPISGTFANLPDGGTLTIGSNTLQAGYEGGDGNDLTLTVVP